MRKHRFAFTVFMSAVLLAPVDQAISDPLDQWNFHIIDTDIETAYPSIRVDSQGYPHLAYVREDATTREISVVYAHYTGSCWAYSYVASGGEYNNCFLALDGGDNPSVVYLSDLSSGYSINYATPGSGGSWVIDELVTSGNSGYLGDFQVGPDGYPRIIYDDADWSTPTGDKDHMYLYYDGSSWQEYELYDYCVGIFVGGISMTVASDNTVHLSEYRGDEFVSYLYHGQGTGSSWQWETVLTDCFGSDSDMDLSPSEQPRIGYIKSNRLNFSYFNGSIWQHVQVDPVHTYIFDCAMATDGSDVSHIAYYGSQSLIYAWGSGSTWDYMELDTTGWVGPEPDIALDDEGNPFIAYNDMDNDWLKLAWYGDPTGIGTQGTSSPGQISITGICPNPGADEFLVNLSVPSSSEVTVAIFDVSGRLVAEPAGSILDTGNREIRLDASDLSTGVYLIRVCDGRYSDTARLAVMR